MSDRLRHVDPCTLRCRQLTENSARCQSFRLYHYTCCFMSFWSFTSSPASNLLHLFIQIATQATNVHRCGSTEATGLYFAAAWMNEK